ncbi:hypothetical protein VTN00DRAFT_1443 [Thermoascus crustaceus]|uniref:uncharacterized protein n=1 Tax=Thermoascus crustaceus TaxID=5088 RepID=UPI0037438303
MATAEGPARAHDRHGRRRPFSNWMKRLANLKNSSSPAGTSSSNNKHGSIAPTTKGSKKNGRASAKLNNPYPLSGTVGAGATSSRNDQISFSGDSSSEHHNHGHCDSQPSLADSGYENQVLMTSAKSTAPTLSTNGDATLSDAYSKAGTMATTACGGISAGGGEGSTFSSPAPSVRSLTTTLTTVQSTAPSAHIYGAYNNNTNVNHHGLPHVNSTHSTTSQQTSIQFTHQFPSSPASAVPPHLAPHGHPTTYSTATANNLLTDNASILTLASSSKRRRRNSLDTNASIRALAPSSIFGGSRESLPLSVLSGNVGGENASSLNAPGVLNRGNGLMSVERSSVYSATGTVGLSAAGERGSFYAASSINGNKQSSGGAAADGSSLRSSHARNDSAGGSVAGISTSAAGVGPPSTTTGRTSHRSSGLGEHVAGDDSDEPEGGKSSPTEATKGDVEQARNE